MASSTGIVPQAIGPVLSRQVTVVEPSRGRLSLNLRDLWHYRELLYFLVWRDVKVRYKQTFLGAAWAIIQPLTAMLIFTAIFGHFAKIPSEHLPYAVFVFAGLLPWNYFAQSIGSSGMSMVANEKLITKIFFPRLVIPLAAIAVPLVDFVLALLVLLGLMGAYDIAPSWHAVAFPAFLGLAVLAAAGVGLWVSALNVRYRDVPYALPFLTQLWLYATPIVYPLSIVPERWRWLFSLNPMTGVIEGFRWSLLGRASPSPTVLAVSVGAAAALALSGLAYFKSVERYFADVI